MRAIHANDRSDGSKDAEEHTKTADELTNAAERFARSVRTRRTARHRRSGERNTKYSTRDRKEGNVYSREEIEELKDHAAIDRKKRYTDSSMVNFKAPSPFTLIIFGASGHLARIKLYPSLYTLALKERLPKDFVIMGYARTPMTNAAFRAHVKDAIIMDHREVNERMVGEFLQHVHYHAGQYDSQQDMEALCKRLKVLERGIFHIRLTYLSVPPATFPSTLETMKASNVQSTQNPCRCIVEKPVGNDGESFLRVKALLEANFDGNDIYLLDHYLGKEAVRNIYYLRLANPVLESILKNTLIQHVQISAFEDAGIEGRAGYFEQTGTFRDMVQSHLLMMMSLLTMRLRENDDGIVESRLEALRNIYLPPVSRMDDIVLQGQYASGEKNGIHIEAYREETGVHPQSRTNTFAALKLMSRSARWQGVPFYLRSGKRLSRKETRITIHFQSAQSIGKGATPNRLEIILQGEAGMRFHLQTKMGGVVPSWRPLIMDDPLVCVGDCLPEHSLLLLEAIHGIHHWYLCFDEVQTSWRLIDPLQHYLDQPSTKLPLYPAGSGGPKEADSWIERDGNAWF